ncbi:hypothetical protein ACX6XY_20355 [Streptomyces sp. O3]
MPGVALAAEAAGGVKVAPAKATPGSEVELLAAGCDGTKAVAASEAFVADADLAARAGKGFPLSGEAMIRSTVTPGTYEITVTCDGGKGDKGDKGGTVRGELEVVRKAPADQATGKPSDQPATTASPTAPIRAGGGGTADDRAATVSAADGQSSGSGYLVLGVLFASAAGLTVAGLIRRRRRGQ